MKMKYFLLAAMLIVTANVNAVTINFTGTLGFIEMDNGTSIYSGLSVGDSLSGDFIIGNSSSDASSIDIIAPTATGYNFMGAPYGGTITDGSVVTVAADSYVGVGDNDDMGDDTFILNNLYDPDIPYDTISDTWDVSSDNGMQSFGITLYSLDTGAISGLDYTILPYALEQADYAIFYIEDKDVTGATTYLATGYLTSVSVTVTLSDYLVTPNPGDSWTYIHTHGPLAGTEFTVTEPWYVGYCRNRYTDTC
jgi:hypothetical protein